MRYRLSKRKKLFIGGLLLALGSAAAWIITDTTSANQQVCSNAPETAGERLLATVLILLFLSGIGCMLTTTLRKDKPATTFVFWALILASSVGLGWAVFVLSALSTIGKAASCVPF